METYSGGRKVSGAVLLCPWDRRFCGEEEKRGRLFVDEEVLVLNSPI
jgi:hypothetical protein